MKKNAVLFCVAGIAAVVMVGRSATQSETTEGNDLLMANVEALTEDETHSPCDNINGYKSWATHGFLQIKREFYDCCYVLREGYSPEGVCQKINS